MSDATAGPDLACADGVSIAVSPDRVAVLDQLLGSFGLALVPVRQPDTGDPVLRLVDRATGRLAALPRAAQPAIAALAVVRPASAAV